MSSKSEYICYTLFTKDSASQTLHTKGALKTFQKIEDFLYATSTKRTLDKPTIEFHLFGVRWKERKTARDTYRKLEIKFGKPIQAYSSFKIIRPFWGMDETNSWEIEPENIIEVLQFIDNLGSIPKLSSRPSVYVNTFHRFWLKHPDINLEDKGLESSFAAFLSPSSNTGVLNLVTPFTENNAPFRIFREELQSRCPIDLKDKYFYTRKFKKTGAEYFRRLFTASS